MSIKSEVADILSNQAEPISTEVVLKAATQILALVKSKLPKEKTDDSPGYDWDKGAKTGYNYAIKEIRELLGDGK